MTESRRLIAALATGALLAGAAALGAFGCAAGYPAKDAAARPSPHARSPRETHRADIPRAAFDLGRRSRAAEPWERVGTFDELWVIERPAAAGPALKPRPGQGELRAIIGRKQVPLALEHTNVQARVSAFLSTVNVTQRFHNPYRKKIEAVYAFPLPGNAAVTDFVVRIGERRIRGIIREHKEARKIYEEARRQGYVAALLTQERPNVFAQKIGNLEPGKRIDVRMSYFGPLRCVDGEYEFVFPMVAGAGKLAAQRAGREVAVKVDLDAGTAVEKVYSPTHAVEVARKSASRFSVTLAAKDRIPNRDFVLRCRPAGGGVRTALLVHQSKTGNYFALLLQPPAKAEKLPRTKREMIFVLDCSASMSGRPFAKIKETVRRCLRDLDADDTFQIIRFSKGASALGARPLPATAANVRRGLAWLDSLSTWGGTAMTDGVRAALELPADRERLRVVSFMTDGYIGDEAQVLAAVKEKVGRARIFSFGAGGVVNRHLLERMARLGRGAAAFPDLKKGSPRVEEFYRLTGRPALADIEIDWGGTKVVDVYPQRIPDLFAGRPVLITGRFEGRGKGTVRVSGRAGGEQKSFAFNVNPEAAGEHSGVEKLWARWKIAGLHEREMSRPSHELRRQVTATSLRHGVLCRYTALLTVDSLRKTKGGGGEAGARK